MSLEEAYSYIFVARRWPELRRMPLPDQGFEETFRRYICEKGNFANVSTVRDLGFGLRYSSLSTVPHELDVVCANDREIFVFELKHYEATEITKEIVFTFLGKVIDFDLRNADALSPFKITMVLVTINKHVGESVRKLCLTYGIKLIEPGMMTLAAMNHFARDLNGKIDEANQLKGRVEKLIGRISDLREAYDYSLSDMFRYENGRIVIEIPDNLSPDKAVSEIGECHRELETARQTWKQSKS